MAKIFVRERNRVGKGEGLPRGTGQDVGDGSGGGHRELRGPGRRRHTTEDA